MADVHADPGTGTENVVALAALTREAERAAAAGDYRKALVGELFAAPLTIPETPLSALTDGYAGVAPGSTSPSSPNKDARRRTTETTCGRLGETRPPSARPTRERMR